MDYNLMAPDDMDELLFSDFERALGEETSERIKKQFENYDYYNGKQHRNEYGELVKASELERPDELDYDPTRYATNYFKTIINRKARWQMSGEHGISVPRRQIDDPIEMLSENYEPSAEQEKENERAENYERLLYRLWDENKMRTRLIQAARDRLIADRAVCKIVFNQRTGKLRWLWRPDTEFIPIYSDDDFEEMIACHFIRSRIYERGGEEIEAINKQTFRLNEDGECYLEEAIYAIDDLEKLETILDPQPMGLDFIPVVAIPVDELLGSELGESEIDDLREQNDVLNTMNEDAIDSLKFEMFPMTAIFNAPEGTADRMAVAPGSVVEARGSKEGLVPDIKKVESGFRWKEAFKDQYARVKGAMHEVSGLPQVVPQELNFGGLNGEALQVLFHDIITDTEEHWLSWGYGLKELHEKSIRYLQARTGEKNFAYDKQVVNSIDDYESEIKFVLPLPDNRKELVQLLSDELSIEAESHAGAMERLGVDNVAAKKAEIEQEKMREKQMEDPYGGAPQEEVESDDNEPGADIKQKERRNENGELEVLCDKCGGSGQVISRITGDQIQCPQCKGTGWFQPRKR